MNLQNLAYAHALKQNIVQFTTEAGSKSSLIVRKCFCRKICWHLATQHSKNCLNGKKNAFFPKKKVGRERVKPTGLVGLDYSGHVQ